MGTDVSAFDYHSTKDILDEELHDAINRGSAVNLIARLKPLIEAATGGIDSEIRSTVDVVIRNAVIQLLAQHVTDSSKLESFLNISIETGRAGVSTPGLPISLLSDIFDVTTLEECEKIFSLIESRVEIWKNEPFFKSIKNQLLRTCNDLLRRLSRSQNTVFCGRILVFLARFFPLFEKSGLNLVGEFNKDNVIAFESTEDQSTNSAPSDGAHGTDLEEGEEVVAVPSVVPAIDVNLHRKFWHLQDFFRQPQLCYQPSEWQTFRSYTSDILSAFSSIKLDPASYSNIPGISKSPDNVYFAKYLTNQKLLELQLSDSNFRRYILIQFLITIQYLTQNVKFKTDTQVLTEEQKDFIKGAKSQVMELITQTPPNGAEMAKVISQILEREGFWNEWKNEGCAELKPEEMPKPKILIQKAVRGAGDEIMAAERLGKYSLGNKELTRLWNQCPDNWEACRSKKRVFTPTVEEYFEEIANANKDKRVRTISGDPNFTWRGLRLLSQKSNHFFASNKDLVRPIYAYMDSVIDSLSLVKESSRTNNDAMDDAEDISDEEFLRLPDDGGRESNHTSPGRDGQVNGVSMVTKELISRIAPKVANDWKRLAREFTFGEDEIEYWESETPTDATQAAERMLLIWMEQFPEEATIARLQEACLKFKIELKI